MNEIVKEYAAGLFALAHETGCEEELLCQFRAVAPLFSRDYARLLSNPDLPKSERIALIGEALDGRVNPYLANFVKLMTERGLASEIRPCFAKYENLWCAANGVVRVRAESATELTGSQKARLEEKLGEKTGRRVLVEYAVEPGLIGGMRLFYDNRQIDDTVRNRLKEIAERLADFTLK